MAKVSCDNCDWEGDDEDTEGLAGIHHLYERLDPGATVPAGECPECEAFVYLVDVPEHFKPIGPVLPGAEVFAGVKPRNVVAYDILQKLYAAARNALLSGNFKDLLAAVLETEAAADESKKLDDITESANKEYGCADGDREIDVMGYMTHHNGNSGYEDGYWIDAWLWVANPDAELDDEEDDDEPAKVSEVPATAAQAPVHGGDADR